MKIISRWAATHARYAIPLIVLLNLLLGWLCYRLGMLLVDSGFRFPAMTSLLAFLALLLLAFAYPHPQKKIVSASYSKRKRFDLLIILIGCVGLTATVNRLDQATVSTQAAWAFTVPPTADVILLKWKANPSNKLSRSEKRILKKEFFRQWNQLRKSVVQKDMDATGRTLLIIFTIIMAIGAAGLLSALVCQLSCNGAAFAATAVALLGGVGLILGTIFIIKAINKKYRKSLANKTNTNK